jgi:hypothetical protein
VPYIAEYESVGTIRGAAVVPTFVRPFPRPYVAPAITGFGVITALLGLSCFTGIRVQAASMAGLRISAAITTDRTPVIFASGIGTPVVTPAEIPSGVPNLVVTTNRATSASASNCTPQVTPGIGTNAACGLGDALAYAATSGGAGITFSSTVFKANNTTAQNTIAIPQVPAAGGAQTFVIPANTTITGPTTVIAGVTTNLVTIAGAIGTVTTTGAVILQASSGATSINNLNLTGGQGAIKNSGSMTVTGCVITGNNSFAGGGGIYNSGAMTVKNTTIAGNKATPYSSQYGLFDGGPGGGIYNSGGLTVIASTISGNSTTGVGALPGGSGGGIYNLGTLSVINSTITANTAVESAGQGQISPSLLTAGGGIDNSSTGTFTAINSTITGNIVTLSGYGAANGPTPAAGSGGGGIAGLSTLENTIVSGNSSNVGSNDYEGNFDNAGGNLVAASTALQLAPLGNFGGPTQTMIPLPGSPANCLGALANANNAGLTTDQRGYPRAVYYSGVPVTCVDAGAVQTSYALSFTTQPPATTPVNVAIKPAPVVELTESGILFPYYTGEVGLIDTDRALVAPTLAPLVKGVATFSDAVITEAVTNDTLTAVLGYASTPAVPTLNLVANASVKVSVPVAPGVLVAPAPGSTLTGGTVTFTWTASDVPGTQYQLLIGTNGQGSNNIYVSPPLNGTSVTANVPTTGATLFVGLSQGTTGPWLYTPYTFKEAKITLAAITSPAPSATLTSGTVTFKWSASSVPGTQYQLQIGTNGSGSNNVYISPVLSATSVTVTVPTTGATLYVGLSQGTAGPWTYTPYTYTEEKTK